MKRSTIKITLALGLLPACCFDEAGESLVSNDSGSSSESDGSQSSTSVTTTATTSATTASTSATTAGSEGSSDDGSSSDGTETSEGGSTESSSSNGSETSTAGACEFSGEECFDDGDCGIPGICFADTQHCFHWCATDADCPSGTVCFLPGAFGSYCVDCGGDDSLCAGGESCNGNDCAEADHPECITSGMPCEISDRCVLR